MKCEEIEIYLSGYLDRELTQQQVQFVELHLTDCAICSDVLDELKLAKEATRELEMQQPTLQEWNSMETTILEKGTRSIGWLVLIVWAVVTVGYGAFQFATSPTEPLFEKILVFGLFLGFGLIFLSVLFERLRERQHDRYRGVIR
ncbi:MAG: zf-HC2 domain-containing protein [Acidobacteriota bacterium]|nr:MAG: zf-HC2 domain-containing protein [Acidobacteriota bacterium]